MTPPRALVQLGPSSGPLVICWGLLRTDTLVRLLRDRQEPQMRFVLRVATALRDKPKPPKGGCVACQGFGCICPARPPQASYGA